MSLKKMLDLKDKLIFRLTFMYALLFIIASFLVLLIFYMRVSSITMNRTDTELLEEINEFSSDTDVSALISELASEVESEEENDIFFRLFSIEGKVLGAWNKELFGELKIPTEILASLKDNDSPIFRTIKIPGKNYNFRSIYGVVISSTVLQIGQSLEDNEEYLRIFRRLFALLILPLCFLAGSIGWVMAKKALHGVEEITQTAIDISDGSFDKRVQVKKRSKEIDRLANVFNRMVDRLQTMIYSMREMNDNIAHDLRSPLARIRGIAEMMLTENKSNRDFEEMAISTIEECDNLINIINTMLDITEIEVGLGEFKRELVDLNQLIREAVELFSNIAEDKEIQVSTHLAEKCYISGDKNKLQRLVTNLLENAIKYTQPGGRVNISAIFDYDKIHMKFEDTGIGIPEADLPKIFDRFYRCDASRSNGGIGLGLSLVKAIVKASSGFISVKSTMGKGSVFTVSMPKSANAQA